MNGRWSSEGVRFVRMSKYGEFEVVGTVRRKCKRINDPNADQDGMREYSVLKCPHCRNETIEIANDNIQKQKYTVIRDHILACPSYTGERPQKRGKPASDTSEIDDLKQRMTESEVKHESTKAQLDWTNSQLDWTNSHLETVKTVVAQHQVHWGDLARVMGYEPPMEPPFLLDKCRELRRLQLTNPEGAYNEHQKNMALILEQKDMVIKEKTLMLEQKGVDFNSVVNEKNLMLQQQDTALKQQDTALKAEMQMATDYKKQLDTKDSELSKMIKEMGRLQKERDQLKAKLDALGTKKPTPGEMLRHGLEQAHKRARM